jgi:hypothetical protein
MSADRSARKVIDPQFHAHSEAGYQKPFQTGDQSHQHEESKFSARGRQSGVYHL